jgi:hypothetical protein
MFDRTVGLNQASDGYRAGLPSLTCWRSSGSAKVDSGLVVQGGDPLGPEHRRELAKQAWQAPGWHDRVG